MGCLESKIQAVQAGENYEESVQRPLMQWTGPEVETLLRQHPVLESYASTVLKVIRTLRNIHAPLGIVLQGTVGAVFAQITDEVLKQAGQGICRWMDERSEKEDIPCVCLCRRRQWTASNADSASAR